MNLQLYLESIKKFTNFIYPNMEYEEDEFKRTSEELGINYQELLERFKKAKTIILTDIIWNELENTDSNNLRMGDLEKAKSLAKEYDRDINSIIEKINQNKGIEMPIIFNNNGKYYLIAGNTRLMAFRVLGMYPKVLIF